MADLPAFALNAVPSAVTGGSNPMSSRETWPMLPWPIHSAPSGPAISASLKPPGIRYFFVNVPSNVIRETTPLECSEIHSAPSGPAIIATGSAFSRGSANSSVNSPAVVIREITLSLRSAT